MFVCMIEIIRRTGHCKLVGSPVHCGETPAKLSCGGGEVVFHSSVVASQGLSDATRPLKMLQMKLK